MKFLIVSPRYVPSVGVFYSFPVGLSYISSSLKKNQYDVTCLNSNHYYESMENLLEHEIVDNKIDVLCTGGLSPHYINISNILRIAKNIKPDIITVIGGGLVSCEPKIVLESLPADIGVIGEGDNTIIEIANALNKDQDLGSIEGIVYKDHQDNIRMTLPRKRIMNIDEIQYPDYDGFEIDKYLTMQFQNDEDNFNFLENPRIVPIVASRGCPYNCTFCFHPIGRKYRQHSLQYLFAHIDMLISKYNINSISLIDELFSSKSNHKRLIEFCHKIKNYNIYWFAQMRVDSVNQDILALCKDSGCLLISYGIESASNKILKSLKKHITVGQIEKTLEHTYQAGIGNKGNIIFGDKEETLETINESLIWWQKNRKYQIQLSTLNPYPGTYLYHYAISNGLIHDKLQFLKAPTPINLTEMSDDQFRYVIHQINIAKHNLYMIPGYVISCKKIGIDRLKGPIYSLLIRCPHCKMDIHYNNMNHNANHIITFTYLLYCRKCRQKFSTLPFNLEESICDIISSIGDDKVAIWDNSIPLIHTSGMRLQDKIDYIIAVNSSVPNNHFAGKPVIHYDGNNKNISNFVDHVIYPINDFKAEHFDLVLQLQKDLLNVHTLYVLENHKVASDIIFGLFSMGKYGEAKVVLKQARDQFPISPDYEVIEAHVDSLEGHLGEAKRKYSDIIRRWPSDWKAYNNLGYIAYNDGDLQNAIKLYLKASELSPDNSIIMNNIEQCAQSSQSAEGRKDTIQ